MDHNKIYFYTASINKWKLAIESDDCKKIVTDSLKYLVDQKAIRVFAFVIMPNHIHIVWKLLNNETVKNHQLSFMKFTSQKLKFWLLDNKPDLLEELLVEKKDRRYQLWQRNPLAVELYSPAVIMQKLDYIHNNPCQGKWMLAGDPVSYPFSSASFYETGTSRFKFLTHIGEEL